MAIIGARMTRLDLIAALAAIAVWAHNLATLATGAS